MKLVSTLCIAFMLCFKVYSQANVTFAAPSGYKLKVVINKQTQEDEQYVRFVNLNQGNYVARITATADGDVYTLQSNIKLVNKKETSYFIIIINKTAQVHWANEAELPDSQPVVADRPTNQSPVYSDNYNNSQSLEEYGQERYSNDRNYDQKSHQGNYSRPNTIACDCNNPFPVMSRMEATRLKGTVQRTSFDEDRLALIQTALMRVNIMSADVRDLMRLLNFDNNRLKFAKNVYERTCDKQNYYLVSGSFDFSSNARELQRYIQIYR